jgi:hypothetical protein
MTATIPTLAALLSAAANRLDERLRQGWARGEGEGISETEFNERFFGTRDFWPT